MPLIRWVPNPGDDKASDCEKEGWRFIHDVEGLSEFLEGLTDEEREFSLGKIAIRGQEAEPTVLFLPNGIFMGAQKATVVMEDGEITYPWMVLPVIAVATGKVTPGYTQPNN